MMHEGLDRADSWNIRLFYRAWLVLRIPLPQLVDLLGLEVPLVPDVSLAGIDSNSVTLHWARSESGAAIVKYVIQVNGIVGMASTIDAYWIPSSF